MAVSIATQVLSPIVLLIGTFVSGILPIPVTRYLLNCGCDSDVCKPSCHARKGKVVTSFLVYFGGGVLLATCLVHLLPEAREAYEHAQEAKHHEVVTILPELEESSVTPFTILNSTLKEEPEDHEHGEEFHIPEFIVCCGFFAVYLVEEIVHFFLGGHGHSHVPHESRAIRSLSRSGSCHSAKPPLDESGYARHCKDSSGEVEKDTSPTSAKKSGCFGNLADTEISLTGLLTLIALSFHSVFEGFAIGIQTSDAGVWILFAAVSVHKFVIAFVVGLEVLAEGAKSTLLMIYMAVFAGMSPLGMIIASITQASVEESNPMLVGILNAIATGTLLYVTFCEILQREEDHKNLKAWQQFLATFAGFGVMCLVQLAATYA